MLTEEERTEYQDLEEGKWTMSGYGPGSDEQRRRKQLKRKMWDGVNLEKLFQEGDVSVGKFNRKDPYEDIGYQGHFNIELNSEDWETSMTYRPFFDLDYEERVLEISANNNSRVVEEGEKVIDIRSSETLKETVKDHLGV